MLKKTLVIGQFCLESPNMLNSTGFWAEYPEQWTGNLSTSHCVHENGSTGSGLYRKTTKSRDPFIHLHAAPHTHITTTDNVHSSGFQTHHKTLCEPNNQKVVKLDGVPYKTKNSCTFVILNTGNVIIYLKTGILGYKNNLWQCEM